MPTFYTQPTYHQKTQTKQDEKQEYSQTKKKAIIQKQSNTSQHLIDTIIQAIKTDNKVLEEQTKEQINKDRSQFTQEQLTLWKKEAIARRYRKNIEQINTPVVNQQRDILQIKNTPYIETVKQYSKIHTENAFLAELAELRTLQHEALHPAIKHQQHRKLKNNAIPALDMSISDSKQVIVSTLRAQTKITESKVLKSVGHLIISLPPNEHIEEDEIHEIIAQQFARIGIDPSMQPHFVFQHSEGKNEHYHVLFSRVRNDGYVWNCFQVNHALTLQAEIQCALSGRENQMFQAMTAKSKSAQYAQRALASGTFFAELRQKGQQTIRIPVAGIDAAKRIHKASTQGISSPYFIKYLQHSDAYAIVNHVCKTQKGKK